MEFNLSQSPTVFHITHWKAGSQWLHRIMRDIALDKIVPPQLHEKQFLEAPIVRGALYPTVYVTREQFFSVKLPENYKKFIIIRDLRDTLISAYFSIRFSHAVIESSLGVWRARLEATTVDEGLVMLMDEWLPSSAAIQKSWIASGEKILRYEDLLEDDTGILCDVLLEDCGLPVSREHVESAIRANRFEKISGGRKPGEEDVMAHERKGISGDWKNYFTRAITRAFEERYGALLIQTGYA